MTRVPLKVRDGAWMLDLDALLAAVTERTRVLLVNAPNNPTGWTLTRAEQQAILAHCRRMGTWIIADEVYERLYFEPGAAEEALRRVRECARGDGNLLYPLRDALAARCTVGEICNALRDEFGTYDR